MAAAIPMAVGVAAGAGAYMMAGAGAFMMAFNVGMMAMTATQMIMGLFNKDKDSGKSNREFANVPYTARTMVSACPRVYGTARLSATLAWFGNYHNRETTKSQAESRTY